MELGEIECVKLFRSIGQRHGYSLRTGHSLLANLVASGEMPMALTVYNHTAERVKRKDAPIGWFAMKPMIGQPGAVAMTKRAPHPHSAVLFYDFALGEGQAVLKERQFIVTSKNLEFPVDRELIKVLDSDLVLDQAKPWQELFDSAFLPRRR